MFDREITRASRSGLNGLFVKRTMDQAQGTLFIAPEISSRSGVAGIHWRLEFGLE
jgi:hypothetical protein